MTSSDLLFQRAILASLLVLAVLGAAYFRFFGPRAWAAVLRIQPIVIAAAVAAPIVFDLPLVAKALCWLVGFGGVLFYLLAFVFFRFVKARLRAKRKPT